MFGAFGKVAIATVGTTGAFIAAKELGMLPGYFESPSGSSLQQDEAQQRGNSFIAGVITSGVVTGIVLAIWKR